MRQYDYIIRELEDEIRDNPHALKLLDELVRAIGDLEQIAINNSWNGYVDRMGGSYDNHEVGDPW